MNKTSHKYNQEVRVLIMWDGCQLICKYIFNGQQITQSLNALSDCQEKYYVMYWLLLTCKDLLANLYKIDILFGLSEIENTSSDIKIGVSAFISRINNTKRIIRSIHSDKNKINQDLNTNKVLWLGPKDLRSVNFTG